MYDPRSRYRPLRFFTEPLIWLLSSLMIGLALLSFALAWRDEQSLLDARLNADTTEITRLIEDTMTENERSLLATRALFAASHTIERTTFSEFVTPLLERLARTQAIGWAPRVPATARAAFEQSVQTTGVPDFMLYERNTNGQRVPVAERPEYFPATFIEPFALNREILGFDIGSDSSRLQTLDRARDTGQPALTPPVHLVQTTDENYGLLLILAVYRQDAPTDSLTARRENLLGMVYSRFQMSALLDKAQSQLNPRDIELYVFDVSDAQPQLLAFHASHSGAQVLPAGASPDPVSLETTLHSTTQFESYGRTWRIVARPGPAYVAAMRSWDAWSRLIIGLLSVVVFLLYMYIRKRADDLLQQSQARLELAQAVTHLGSWELDLATGRGVWSQEMYQLFQRDPTTHPPVFEEFIQGVHPEDRTILQAALMHAGATGERVTVEHRDNAPPDAVRHFEVTIHTVRDAQGRPIRLAGAVHDITARHRTEARLRRLNRTYALQSEINQTIVRVRDMHELFAATCQIVVAQGEFCMAWIGRPDPQTRRVYPVAHAGAADGYLETLSIVVDDSAARDAYASTLHAGGHVVINDIAGDLRMGPWRDAAQRLGYRASAIFPLMVAGEVYGALNLYASELDFFDADELKLLDEIATDIAFAIEFIEQDAQRRLAEEKLRTSEARYRLLAENTSDVIWQLDIASGQFTYVSPSVQHLRGYTSEEVMACSVSDVLTPESNRDVTGWLRTHLVALEAGENPNPVQVNEVDQPHRDGHIIPVEVVTKILRDPQTGTLTVLGVSRDITARRQAEVALKQSEARYRVIFEGANEGIITVRNEDRSFLYINPAMSALFGYTHDEFLQLTVTHLHPSETLPYVLAEFESLVRSEKTLVANIPCIRKDGSVFYADVKAALARLDNLEVLVSFFNDVTERLQAEEALIAERNSLARRVEERTADLSHVNTELARVVRAKDEFLANMSHELRTPLNAILGISEVLLEQFRGPLNERQQESLRDIQISGHHLLALINDILDLAKVESGQMELQMGPVVIAEMCEISLLFIKEQALKKQLHLALHLDDQRAIMYADSKRLKQMLVNLLSNAVKFTEAGGQVSLEVQTDAEAGVVRFVVEDTGIGMNPEGVTQLFQPFVQLDSRLSRQHEGTGLGLALVRRLAGLHNGSVTVESELGQGSRFTVALPYASREMMAQNPADHALIVGDNALRATPIIENRESSHEAPMTMPPHEQSLAGGRVLMVEDNTINITTVGGYLQDRGYHLMIARNGREALDIVAEARPDVILMDIQMAEMDGLETTRRLRAMPDYQNTPIIALTALAMPGDREQCLAAGANAYLTKPVRLKGLVETMQRLLKSASLTPP
jgi:PAS domain S-box-containing protein